MRYVLVAAFLFASQASFAEDAAPSASSVPPQAIVMPPHPAYYPPLSIRLGEEGRVVVRYLVREDGTVGDAIVVQSSGSQRLDDAGIATVHRWKFKPALKDGKPVASWATSSVVFRLH